MSTQPDLARVGELIAQNKYGEALAVLRDLEAAEGSSPDIEYGKGICLAALGRVTEARAVFRHLRDLGQVALAQQLAEHLERTDRLDLETIEAPGSPPDTANTDASARESRFYRNAFYVTMGILLVLIGVLWGSRTHPAEITVQQPPTVRGQDSGPSWSTLPVRDGQSGIWKEEQARAAKEHYSATLRVVASDGTPVSGAAVGPWFTQPDGSHFRYGGYSTDENGRFTYTGFPAGIRCGFNSDHINGYTAVETDGFVGRAGETLPEIAVVVEKLVGVVSGTATDVSGKPLAAQQFIVNATYDDGVKAVLLVKSDGSGLFRFDAGRPRHEVTLAFQSNGPPSPNLKWASEPLHVTADAPVDLGSIVFLNNG